MSHDIVHHFFSRARKPGAAGEGGPAATDQWLEIETSTASPTGSASSKSVSNTLADLWRKRWVKAALGVAAVLVVLVVALAVGLSASAKRSRFAKDGMTLIFEDEFTSLDSSIWRYDLGDGSTYGLAGWGNSELQCYTASPDNVDIMPNPAKPQDGVLRIRSSYSQQPLPCVNPAVSNSSSQWTSGKIDTKGKAMFSWSPPQLITNPDDLSRAQSLQSSAAQASGATNCGSLLIEARLKVPLAAGRWSALWMMPQPQPGRFPGSACGSQQLSGQVECGAYGAWPASGEMDIMEHVNADQEVLGTVHYANGAGQHAQLGNSLQLPTAALQDWNLYQLKWSCDAITWLVNGQQMHRVARDWVQPIWPFDEPFFLIINTAVGGMLTRYTQPDQVTAAMLVDYVRVYSS